MYKSKLQEICHKKEWGLPTYTSLKHGSDHNPWFTASVSLNGFVFDTPSISKSCKEAENCAAKLALLHFPASDTAEPKAEIKAVEPPMIVEAHQSTEMHSNTLNMKDLPNQYKMLLQIYAQRNKLGIPVYSSEREGPPHDLCFKAKVIVGMKFFESPGFYKNLKEAEHAAAQVALMSMSTESFQKNGSQLYKHALQELAQNEGFFLPKYQTTSSGESHHPTFFSTVEVEGETFHGAAAKSKKEAESNAAKTAYTALMKNKARRTTNSSSAASSEDEAVDTSRGSESLRDFNLQGSFESGCSFGSPSAVKGKEQTIEDKDEHQKVFRIENVPACTKCSSHKLVASPLEMDEITGKKYSCALPLEPQSLSPTSGQSSSSMLSPSDISALSIADSNTKKSCGTESYLLNNRFRVYTSYPNMDFPKGTVVLPISEDKWVAVSLEFPKEINA